MSVLYGSVTSLLYVAVTLCIIPVPLLLLNVIVNVLFSVSAVIVTSSSGTMIEYTPFVSSTSAPVQPVNVYPPGTTNVYVRTTCAPYFAETFPFAVSVELTMYAPASSDAESPTDAIPSVKRMLISLTFLL